ncbi:hypothetical protein EON65_07975 [archaeon]|nr:MAG: hypothetical protein EON65_07975 [archaeon]
MSNPNHSQWTLRENILVVLTLVITLLLGVELANVIHIIPSHAVISNPIVQSKSLRAENTTTYSIAIGIFSVHRPQAPDYVYFEVMSILDTLFVDQKYIKVDKIHVFDGSFNGSQVRYFKYSPHVVVHPMDLDAYTTVENYAVHRKASLNYLLALKYLVPQYNNRVDAFLMLEDDVLFDPHAGYLLWQVLNSVRNLPRFLVDGYGKGFKPGYARNVQGPVKRFTGEARCCSQAFLLSPQTARDAIPLIEMSLNGSMTYDPLDVFLTRSLLQQRDFQFFFATSCWVQHVGYPYLGLGHFHRGCSAMNFEKDIYNQTTHTLSVV